MQLSSNSWGEVAVLNRELSFPLSPDLSPTEGREEFYLDASL